MSEGTEDKWHMTANNDEKNKGKGKEECAGRRVRSPAQQARVEKKKNESKETQVNNNLTHPTSRTIVERVQCTL